MSPRSLKNTIKYILIVTILITHVFINDAMPQNCIGVYDHHDNANSIDNEEQSNESSSPTAILCYYKLDDGEENTRLDQIVVDNLENRLKRAQSSKNPEQPRFKRPPMPFRIGGMPYRTRSKLNRIVIV